MPRDNNYSGTASGVAVFRAVIGSPVATDVVGFCLKVAERFDAKLPNGAGDITDRFFKQIEDRADLLKEYSSLKTKFGQRSLNAQIGRWIKDNYGLENGPNAAAQLSKLIKGYTTHSMTNTAGKGTAGMGTGGA